MLTGRRRLRLTCRSTPSPQRRVVQVAAGLGHRQRAVALDDLVQVLALHVLHDQHQQVADLVGVEGPDDVLVPEPARRPHLVEEAVQRLGPAGQVFIDDLDGHLRAHHAVLGEVDGAHAASAQLAQHPELG